MPRIKIVLCVFPMLSSCITYIDRVESDCNPKFGNLSIKYTHNAEGHSVTNATVVNFVTVTKLLVYVSLLIPENKYDREYRREVLKTVVDAEKVLRGLQSNPITKGFIDNILKYIDFEVKFPAGPVSKPSMHTQYSFSFLFLLGNLQDHQRHRRI